MKQITINCAAIGTMAELHEILARELDFPDWYGRNLDALHDVLTSITGTIRLEGWQEARATLGRYGELASRVIAESALENEKLDIII